MSEQGDEVKPAEPVTMLDWSEMTVGEIEDLEDAMWMPLVKVQRMVREASREAEAMTKADRLIDSEADEVMPAFPMKLVRALVWIAKRRQEPSFTFADARNVTPSGYRWAATEGPAADPSDAPAETA